MGTKNSLAIRLVEPIIFLHPTSSRPHAGTTAATSRSSLLRGLLTLNLTRPTRISGIEIELLCRSCTVWDEGLGSSRLEIREELEVYRASTVFFEANKTANQAGSGWKDFAKGVYNYPISFAIPANAPPSLECKFGFIQWLLKARVHRPGPFAPKMTCARDLTLIPYLSEDAQQPVRSTVDHPGSRLLHLDVELSSRNAYIGTRIPMQFMLRPLSDEVKVSEVAVWLEERVDYYTRMRIARTEPLRRTQLLWLRNSQPSKDQYPEPILPLSSSSTSENSHWLSLLCPNVVQPATLSGRGPWQFSHELQLPETCSDVHFSSVNPAGNVTITHNLKTIALVLLSSGEDSRKGTAYLRRVEVVNNMPVQLISCCCKPEWANLPAYSASSHSDGSPHTCPCTPKRNKSPDDSSAHPPHPHHHNHLLYRRQEPTGDTSSAIQFEIERLVSGQASAAGETPPSYESVYASPPSLLA